MDAATALERLLLEHPEAWSLMEHIQRRDMEREARQALADELAHEVCERNKGISAADVQAAIRVKANL